MRSGLGRIVGVVIVLLVALGVAVGSWYGRPRPPNVLIIVADDVGTDKISGYEEHPLAPPTPRIDALAAQGVRFRNAYAYPLCSPSRAALLTGRYGRRNGIGMVLRWEGAYELPLAEVTLAELLKMAPMPYATEAVGKWHLAGPETDSGLRHPMLQGFDHFTGTIHQLYYDADGTAGTGKSNYFSWDKETDGHLKHTTQYATTASTDDALVAARRMKEPWFLYVAYQAAHAPFHVPPGSELPEDAPVPAKYDAMVEKMDQEIGRLLDGLPPGERARTVVLFLGDNGTDPQAVVAPRNPDEAKKSMYEGGTNVPFVMSGPGIAKGVSDALVHVVNVLPTIADLVGVDPALTHKTLDGVSFAGVLKDPSSAGRRKFLYTERFQPAGPPPWKNRWQAVRDDRYKLVTSDEQPPEFYNLQGRFDDGPPESPDNLTGEPRARYEALKAELDRITATVKFEY